MICYYEVSADKRMKDYNTFKYLWRNEYLLDEVPERLRVLFYRTKKTYKKIESKIKNESWLEGYCEGAELTSERKALLFYFYVGQYKK